MNEANRTKEEAETSNCNVALRIQNRLAMIPQQRDNILLCTMFAL